jgi:hypothetical protein
MWQKELYWTAILHGTAYVSEPMQNMFVLHTFEPRDNLFILRCRKRLFDYILEQVRNDLILHN